MATKKKNKKEKNLEEVETVSADVVETKKEKLVKEKKEKKVKNKSSNDSAFDSDMTRILTVVGIILLIFCVFYWITVLVTNKDRVKDNDDTPTEASISYDRIVLGRSFSMSDSSYYVLYYDMKDEDIASTYSSLVSTHKGKSEVLPLYVVNMGDVLNSSAVADSSNKSATDASELKINGPTLIKFSEGKIVEYIEGEEAITSTLK